ncbi:hypothetical protein ACROYT_G041431 [Oculina patagonica]
MGLAAPFTVRAKILMRQLWTSEEKLDWDDPIPEKYMREWITFFRDLRGMDRVMFPRCLKPSNVASHQPVLIIFSDGSDNSYGACAYARWSLPEGKYDSRLIMSKNRLAPNKKILIDRVELSVFLIALIKSIKRAITLAIGENVLTFSELQTIYFEAANLVNERPIGRHPTTTDDGAYLCPNDLLLGRSTPRVPSGPFRESANPRHRFEFVQNIVNGFWKRWTRDFFPSLLVRQKWHTSHRNVKVGDIVLIQDSNQIRGNWKLGRVTKAHESKDGKVRKVEVQYKNPKPNEPVRTYAGRGFVTVERPVQLLVIVVPVDHAQANNKDETK